eukprot:6212710-Pleurochrysis_carterae.AAC.7
MREACTRTKAASAYAQSFDQRVSAALSELHAPLTPTPAASIAVRQPDGIGHQFVLDQRASAHVVPLKIVAHGLDRDHVDSTAAELIVRGLDLAVPGRRIHRRTECVAWHPHAVRPDDEFLRCTQSGV